MLHAAWQVGQVLWSTIWFTLFFLWIWLVIKVFADVFRSRDLGGVGKVSWISFVVVLPYLGVFAYLIARGRGMTERDRDAVVAREHAMRAAIQEVAGSASRNAATELTRLADLRDRGVIDEAEFQRMKAELVSP